MDSKLQKRSKPQTCRMFDTPVMEAMSHIPPLSPFIFWVPIVIALAGWLAMQSMSLLAAAGYLAVGWLVWSIFEWTLHRFVFHAVGPRPWMRRFHFIAHGMHHDFPQDADRLVMPLGISAPVGLTFYLLFDLIAARPEAVAIFIGYGIGYLLYDGIHYFTHHMKATTRVGKFLKKYHLVHHFTGVDGLYGVSNPLWDYVFGTTKDRNEPAAKATRRTSAQNG
jgi:dihydroceramide fatty acyl 2-hydroxylase